MDVILKIISTCHVSFNLNDSTFIIPFKKNFYYMSVFIVDWVCGHFDKEKQKPFRQIIANYVGPEV